MAEEAPIDLFREIKRASIQRKEKLGLIQQYFPPSQGIIYFLLLKLTKEQIKEIGEKYANKTKYSLQELKEELFGICGYETSAIKILLSNPKEYSGDDMQWLESHLNEYWREELNKWSNMHLKKAQSLKRLAIQLAKKNIKKNKIIKGLNETAKSLERVKRFDRRKYDPAIFTAAMQGYKKAKGFDRHYGRCLLVELQKRRIVGNNYENSEEFMNYSDAFKKHRSNLVKSNSPKR